MACRIVRCEGKGVGTKRRGFIAFTNQMGRRRGGRPMPGMERKGSEGKQAKGNGIWATLCLTVE